MNDFEGHYTFYPEGGFYARHLDRFHKDNGRVVSFILYLNSSWQPEHGGYLRIYSSDNSYQDVPPKAGTLVCFLSAEVEHEVLPSFSPRYSFTGWFRNRRSL